jgi:hypothetical protein
LQGTDQRRNRSGFSFEGAVALAGLLELDRDLRKCNVAALQESLRHPASLVKPLSTLRIGD